MNKEESEFSFCFMDGGNQVENERYALKYSEPLSKSETKTESASPLISKAQQFALNSIYDGVNSKKSKMNKEKKESIDSNKDEQEPGVESSDEEQGAKSEINKVNNDELEFIYDCDFEEDGYDINPFYDILRECVPNLPNREKLNQAEICRRAVNYILETKNINKMREEEIETIKRETMQLKQKLNSIMTDMKEKCPGVLDEAFEKMDLPKIDFDLESLIFHQVQEVESETETEYEDGGASKIPPSEVFENKRGLNIKIDKMDDDEEIEFCVKNMEILEYDNTSDEKEIVKEITRGWCNISLNEKNNEEKESNAGDGEHDKERRLEKLEREQ